MPIQAVEPRRLYRQIADQLLGLIAAGEYRPGDRLPPERTLSEQLRVSRSSVREALIAMEVEGRVEIRVGAGVFVVDQPAPVVPSTEVGPFELLQARLLVEPQAAALAARHATAEQRDRMARAWNDMAACEASNDLTGLAHDRQFHVVIGEASGNSALALMVQTLWEQRVGPLYVTLERHFHSGPIWEKAQDEHRAILDAIVARQPGAARRAMRRHIRNAERRFAGNWAQEET